MKNTWFAYQVCQKQMSIGQIKMQSNLKLKSNATSERLARLSNCIAHIHKRNGN